MYLHNSQVVEIVKRNPLQQSHYWVLIKDAKFMMQLTSDLGDRMSVSNRTPEFIEGQLF